VLPPSGTVTFLFTDIEGSTRLWEEDPDAMRAWVSEHDVCVRDAIEACGGYVFATGGDGFAAAFGRAADAVAAAEHAQAALTDLTPVRVRMGINTGEAHERGGDYFGPPVNRTARLMAAGHGGQVLLSAVTAELVPDLVVRNLGEHRLRDLGSPMLVLQLGTDEFPPLRTLDTLPGNLPPQRTSFIGRTREVKELAALVDTERLVTLTGPGGVGKSRLALQVGADVAPEFADGVWFASLAALEEGALVAATILEALGVPERQGEPNIETLCAWASTRAALLIVDNCEHLLAEVSVVVDRIAEAAAAVTVLATSQAPLGVRGEHVWTVAPFSDSGDAARDSIELFVDRAHMARADFELGDQNEPAVIEICARLDHVPLAIELAAARVRGMAPADIARRLDQRLRLLSSSDRSAPGRHRTLDAAVRWSYELLDETQRRVFDRLSVFAGPFTIEAAEVVVSGAGVDEWEVLDGILALVDKSLVVADEETGSTRYRLLETMRQFGQANLEAAGERGRYRDRHADYYADFVLSRRVALEGSGDVVALNEIERELENIRVTLRQATDDDTTARFDDLFRTLYHLWIVRGRGYEGAAWARALLDRPVVDARARILALGVAASVTNPIDLDRAREMAETANAIAESTHAAPPLQATAVMALGAMMQGHSEAAVAYCDRVVAMFPEEPNDYIRATVYAQITAVLAICGAFDLLEPVTQQAALLADQLGNTYLRATAASGLAPIIHIIDPDGAGAYLLRAYDLNLEIGNEHANCTNTMFLAIHEARHRNDLAAAEWARTALQLSLDHGPSYIAQTINVVIPVVRRRSPRDAAALLGALRAHRDRKHQDGTVPEIEAEVRYEASLRRALGDEFDDCYGRGLAFDEPALIAFAFAQLGTILDSDGGDEHGDLTEHLQV
jgi:predicted ATPase